ncbi:MAG: response regulator transcription factor [Lentimicrobiaceae bacterium]|jgi:DNA-binding NarL/FixJ family response regulator
MERLPDIIIVDDNLTFRQGLKSILTIEGIANVIGEASDGSEFINILSNFNPDLVLLDCEMRAMNGLEATKIALELIPDLKIIALTLFEKQECFFKMLDLGIKGFVLKSSGINELEKAIQAVSRGENYFSDNLQEKIDYNPGS